MPTGLALSLVVDNVLCKHRKSSRDHFDSAPSEESERNCSSTVDVSESVSKGARDNMGARWPRRRAVSCGILFCVSVKMLISPVERPRSRCGAMKREVVTEAGVVRESARGDQCPAGKEKAGCDIVCTALETSGRAVDVRGAELPAR
jgi:hypothetical protein